MLIAGVDEVGRGPLAGPVVTAAVILNTPISGLADSKKLSPKKRTQLAKIIKEQAYCFAYGRAESEEIDEINIHQATLLAMKRAINALPVMPDRVLIDGTHVPKLSIPCFAIVKGDDLIQEISAASILAKVARDDEMTQLEEMYPGYGFATHKGYGTALHQAKLLEMGPCAIHRKKYAPIAKLLKARVG